MPSSTLGRGNIIYDWLVQASLVWSTATVASTTAELTAILPGVNIGDYVDMYLPNAAMTTGLTVANIRVSAANTLAVTWIATSGTFTVPTGPWLINICRPEAPGLLPASAT
jgi:hypothetical protein